MIPGEDLDMDAIFSPVFSVAFSQKFYLRCNFIDRYQRANIDFCCLLCLKYVGLK